MMPNSTTPPPKLDSDCTSHVNVDHNLQHCFTMKLLQTTTLILVGSLCASAQTTAAPGSTEAAAVDDTSTNETEAGFGSGVSEFFDGVKNTTSDVVSGISEWIDGVNANKTEAEAENNVGKTESAKVEGADEATTEAAKGAEAETSSSAIRFATISALVASVVSLFAPF